MGEEEKKTAEEEKKVEAEGKKGEEKKKQEAAEKKAEGGAEGEKKEEEKDAGGKKDGEGDGKTAEGGGGGGKGEGEKNETPPPPPPEEIVMRVYMHCEGCARKVQRSLVGFPGVEEVKVDCRAHMVVVKGKAAAADPLRVVERLQRKSGRKVELLSPIPPKPEEEEAKKEEEKEKPKPEEEEAPPVIEAVLKVRMHCDACSQEMKKRILKMKGVQSADPDVKASQVTVKGVFDPAALAEHVYRRTGRHAALVKAEPVEEKAPGKEEDKAGGGGGDGEADNAAGGEGEKAEEAADGGAAANDGAAAGKGVEVTKNPYYYHPHHYYYSSYPRGQVEHTYPPQIFSDDNPNACSVM